MMVRVKLFAVARQRVGRDSGRSNADLLRRPMSGNCGAALAEQYPAAGTVLCPHARFAVDNDYAARCVQRIPAAIGNCNYPAGPRG